MTVHHADLVIYPAPERTYVLHESCAELLAEQAAAASAAEEDAAETAASSGATALDATDSSIAQGAWRTDEEDCF